jgi:hypothetical protein
MKKVKKSTLLMLLAAGLSAEVCAAPGEGDSQEKKDSQEEKGLQANADAQREQKKVPRANKGAETTQIDTRSHGNGHNRTLRFLDLGNNEIGNAGASELARALHTNTTLTHLSLKNNSMSMEVQNSLRSLAPQKNINLKLN